MRGSVLGMMIGMGMALSGLGCGGDDGPDATPFIGAWKYTSGTETANCGGSSSTDALSGNVTLMRGVSSPLVSIQDNCTLNLDVTGSTAIARPSQECTQIQDGVNVTIKVTAYSFTVNGVVADESASATFMLSGPTGNVNCTYTATGRLMKVSQ